MLCRIIFKVILRIFTDFRQSHVIPHILLFKIRTPFLDNAVGNLKNNPNVDNNSLFWSYLSTFLAQLQIMNSKHLIQIPLLHLTEIKKLINCLYQENKLTTYHHYSTYLYPVHDQIHTKIICIIYMFINIHMVMLSVHKNSLSTIVTGKIIFSDSIKQPFLGIPKTIPSQVEILHMMAQK